MKHLISFSSTISTDDESHIPIVVNCSVEEINWAFGTHDSPTQYEVHDLAVTDRHGEPIEVPRDDELRLQLEAISNHLKG